MAEPKAFVCGHPIRHSRSPLIHRYWLRRYDLTGRYEPADVAPEHFPHFIAALAANGLVGGNVTIPHKEVIAGLVDIRTEEADEIGAVNTIWFEQGKLLGDNTDAYGFAANLDQQAPGWDSADKAVVLGAGGASRAVIHALKRRGVKDIRILNRTVTRAETLADQMGPGVSGHTIDKAAEHAAGAGLVINTTALGMEGAGELPLDPSLITAGALVTDIVYVPLETPFLAAARAAGLRTADGLGMLLHQAVPGFERWFGTRPEVTPELRAMIIADLEAH